MPVSNPRFRNEIIGALLLHAGVVGAFWTADRLSYRQGANDMSPGLEVALLCGLVLLAAFVRSVVLAIRRRGIFGWLPLWYLVLFLVLAFQFMM